MSVVPNTSNRVAVANCENQVSGQQVIGVPVQSNNGTRTPAPTTNHSVTAVITNERNEPPHWIADALFRPGGEKQQQLHDILQGRQCKSIIYEQLAVCQAPIYTDMVLSFCGEMYKKQEEPVHLLYNRILSLWHRFNTNNT